MQPPPKEKRVSNHVFTSYWRRQMIHIVHSSARQGGIKTVSTILNEGL